MCRISVHEYHRRALQFAAWVGVDIGHLDIVIDCDVIVGERKVRGNL